MVDPKHLETLMALRGLTQAELARRSGVCRQTIGRILRGELDPRNTVVKGMAKAFRVPHGDLDDSCDMERPDYFTWCDVHRARDLYEELRAADTVLSCVKGMPAYLQTRTIHDWAFVRAHQAAGWLQPEIAKALVGIVQTGNGDLNAYQKSRCVHRIIARQWWVQQVLHNQPDWVLSMRSRLSQLDGKVTLGLIPLERERRFEEILTSAVADTFGPPGYWETVSVAMMNSMRPALAVVRPTRDIFLVTHHGPTVERLLKAIREVRQHLHNPEAFPIDPGWYRDIEASVNQTKLHLDQIARSAQTQRQQPPSVDAGLHDKLWAQLALRPKSLEARLNQ